MHDNQITVRVAKELDIKIEKASKKKGLTKASWIRQLIIDTLNTIKN